MKEPRYFYVFGGQRGEPICVLFIDDRPSKRELKERSPVLFEAALAGTLAENLDFSDLVRAYKDEAKRATTFAQMPRDQT